MNFGQAIEALINGKKVARKGWDDKGMFLYLTEGSYVKIKDLRGNAKTHIQGDANLSELKNVYICPHIDMKNANDEIVVGWLASQTDMLSDDWMVIE